MRTEPRQFDVWRLRNGSLVLILQDEIMDHLTSRVVAPLIPASRTGKATKGMNPAFDLGDEPYLLKTELLAAVPVSDLQSLVMNVTDRRPDIIRALDLLFTGV